jgi:starch synthase
MPKKRKTSKTTAEQTKQTKKRGRPKGSKTSRTRKTKKLKIMMVATEAAPYVAIGGASQVVRHLSKALRGKGHEVRVLLPKFGLLDQEKYKLDMVIEGLKVPTGDEKNPYLICNVKSCCNDNVTAYFLENKEYFEKRSNVYGYSDDPTRFALLSRGALEFIKKKIFVPDVIHCNDWHTGVLPNFMKTVYKKDPVISKITTIFTIHNLAFQGTFDHKHVSELEFDDGKSAVAPLFSQRLITQNFMRRGILYADAVNTVSKAYSKEILTPEFGEGLDKLLLELRGKLFGIINGLDYKSFDPSTDTLIEKNYDIKTVENRVVNKRALQKEFDIAINPDAFVLGFVGRLDFMKGVDMLVSVLHHVLKNHDNIQFVQVGGGDWNLSEQLQELREQYPDKVGIHPYSNWTLPRLIFSGADAILYPSRFEPCGIVQIEAMRYGAIPIVRDVGGLSDTVESFDSITLNGTGFKFSEFDEYSLYGQVVRANEIFKNKPMWGRIQQNAMRADFSWDYSAGEYEKLYNKAQMIKDKRHPQAKSVEDLLG